MAVRHFNGASGGAGDELIHTVGTSLATMTYGCIAVIIKFDLTNLGSERTWFGLHTSGGTNRTQQYNQQNHVNWWTESGPDGSGSTSFTGLISDDTWYFILLRRGTGVGAVWLSMYDYAGDSWTHDSGGSFGDFASAGSGGTIRMAYQTGGRHHGLIAARGAWADDIAFELSAAGNTAVESAGLHLSAQAWVDAGVTSLWRYNQASVDDPVDDDVGDANQSSRVGTTVVTDDDPPGWDPTLGGAAVAGAGVGYGTTIGYATPEKTSSVVGVGAGTAVGQAAPATTRFTRATGSAGVVASATAVKTGGGVAAGYCAAETAAVVSRVASGAAAGQGGVFGAGVVSRAAGGRAGAYGGASGAGLAGRVARAAAVGWGAGSGQVTAAKVIVVVAGGYGAGYGEATVLDAGTLPGSGAGYGGGFSRVTVGKLATVRGTGLVGAFGAAVATKTADGVAAGFGGVSGSAVVFKIAAGVAAAYAGAYSPNNPIEIEPGGRVVVVADLPRVFTVEPDPPRVAVVPVEGRIHHVDG